MPEPDDNAIQVDVSEDEEDLAAIAERAHEPTISYEELLAQLRADGTI